MTLIHEQAERAGQIVRNLLTFARTGPVEITSVDLNDIVRRTAALMEYELRLREVSLNVAQAEGVERGCRGRAVAAPCLGHQP